MIIRKKITRMLCGLGILGAMCGIPIVSQAENSYLDVRASGMTNVSSKDPYSQKVTKDDNEQNYYIKLDSLSGGPYLTFYAYRASDKVQMATQLRVNSINYSFAKSYDLVAGVAGVNYYVYAIGAPDCADVHGVGRYCP